VLVAASTHGHGAGLRAQNKPLRVQTLFRLTQAFTEQALQGRVRPQPGRMRQHTGRSRLRGLSLRVQNSSLQERSATLRLRGPIMHAQQPTRGRRAPACAGHAMRCGRMPEDRQHDRTVCTRFITSGARTDIRTGHVRRRDRPEAADLDRPLSSIADR
jgi:hypothetical protein